MAKSENDQENRVAQKDYVKEIIGWALSLVLMSRKYHSSPTKIAAKIIREGGSDRDFGPDKANKLIEAAKQAERAEQTFDSKGRGQT